MHVPISTRKNIDAKESTLLGMPLRDFLLVVPFVRVQRRFGGMQDESKNGCGMRDAG